MTTINSNNALYKGALATLGFIHLAGYAAVTGDTQPLIRAIRDVSSSNESVATVASSISTSGNYTETAGIDLTPNNRAPINTTIISSSTQPTPTSATSIPTSTPPTNTSSPIGISKKADLAQLTNSTGDFILQNDINAKDIKPIQGFRGHLDGQGHAVTNLTNCLFDRLGGYVNNVSFTNGDIGINRHSAFPSSGFAACHTDKESRLDDISVKNSKISTRASGLDQGHLNDMGLVVGLVVGTNHGQISHAHSDNNKIRLSGRGSIAGGIVGEMVHGSLSHSTVTNSSIEANDYAGGIAGKVESDALLSDLHVNKAHIEAYTQNETSRAGGIAGEISGNLIHARVTNTRIEAIVLGREFHGSKIVGGIAGGIVGEVMPQAVVTDSHVEHSNITVRGAKAKAGGIAGYSTGSITHTLAYNNKIEMRGSSSYAGGIIGHNANHTAEPNGGAFSASTLYLRRGNSQGILNHANSSHNTITALERTCASDKANEVVGVNDGLIFDAKSSNNKVIVCGIENKPSQNINPTEKAIPAQEQNEGGLGLTNLQTIAITAGVTMLANSYYNGWKEGERGLILATRPVRSAASAMKSAICFVKDSVTARRQADVDYHAELEEVELIENNATLGELMQS